MKATNLQNMLASLKDYIFPIFCLGCNKEGEWACAECCEKIDCSGIFDCPICHKSTIQGICCKDCQEQSFLDSHIAITKYVEDGVIGKLIYNLKYQFAEDVLEVFEKIIKNFITNNSFIFEKVDLIVPVPLHQRRLAERGFNQAEKIAEIISDVFKKPLVSALERSRYTPKQAKLNKEKRLQNIKKAFSLVKKIDVSNKNILLVDDVFTTGTTLQECAKELKQNSGCHSVIGFSAARGDFINVQSS